MLRETTVFTLENVRLKLRKRIPSVCIHVCTYVGGCMCWHRLVRMLLLNFTPASQQAYMTLTYGTYHWIISCSFSLWAVICKNVYYYSLAWTWQLVVMGPLTRWAPENFVHCPCFPSRALLLQLTNWLYCI